jgi:protease IV
MTNEQDPNRVRVEPSLADTSARRSPEMPAGSGGAGSATAGGRTAGEPGWERAVLERLVMGTIEEQRRARRWRIFFRFVGLAFVLLLAAASFGWIQSPESVGAVRHTAVIEIDGVIEAGGEVDADAVIGALRSAFKDTATAGVIVRINSPGGSPVQAGLISDEILRLRAANPETPLYAVIEEICASGGYYVAAAADRIYVDKASLVGSIGVLMDGFGFTGAMEKLGVERRLLTAGENKGFLDPFSPLADTQREHARKMLGVIHQQFIDTVRKGRGDRLKESPDLFSGLVWTGATSIELGLADELGSLRSVARDVIKAEALVDFTRRENLAERLAKRVGMGAAQVFARQLGVSAETPRLR